MSTVAREKDLEDIINKLKQKFKITNLSKIKWFLNVRIIRDRPNRKIWLCQDSYMDNLASEFKIDVSGVTKTPLPYGELLPYEGEATEQLRHLYSKKVGKVVFPAVVTRPDNAQATSKLAEFLINPGPNHLKAVDHNIYYLVSNKYLTIEYKAENKNGELIAVTDKVFTAAADASYENNPDRRSEEEHIFKLFRGAINWSSRKQSTIITSTTEAELLSISHTAKTSF